MRLIRCNQSDSLSTRVTYTGDLHGYDGTSVQDSLSGRRVAVLDIDPFSRARSSSGARSPEPRTDERGDVEPSEIGINQDYVLDAQKYVQEARRELIQAISDEETAPILAVRVEELGRAEGELQAFTDALDFDARYPSTEVLIRLTEASHDPVLVHDVRREGYRRAVSHIFRGTK